MSNLVFGVFFNITSTKTIFLHSDLLSVEFRKDMQKKWSNTRHFFIVMNR